MGLCVSMLQRKPKNRRPERRSGTPKALFVVRNDRRPSKPQALVVQTQNPGGSGFQKLGKAKVHSRKHEKCSGSKCSCDCTDVLVRRLCAPKPRLPCPCGGTRSVAAVEPVAPEQRGSVFSGVTTERSAVEGCKTPMTPRRTPVWQRRILMGTRCELPRFSGLILYDEHGRPLQSSTPNRANQYISRARKYESKGKKNTARTTTTLRDLL
ncbi:hypothetical protein PR202_gb06999 [Eleusine coracana subsp. coracana]|uniref:Uncharacterized protein n=1 Tax=Eleusine coracana subsp. coracana TaxID=191504 RepID=A0AAV5EA99_ELECO|nr:hypothetical protein QOZ80_2BG0164850 [Eleusine coracana subsp. coracana]GJN19697.1 hypothetical protein PR202_gb06999 [Eleusine coracana subsp. coracana]